MLSEERLKKLYIDQQLSSSAIARLFHCSEHKVNYWLKRYKIPKRTVSEAMYIKHNPEGDPFLIRKPRSLREAVLFGLGLGLYWGEGTKSNKASIRLGNTDPRLVKKFIEFLDRTYGIDRKKLKFGLQVFSDMNSKTALKFWQKELKMHPSQFQKVIVTPARSLGTYRYKTEHGVLTVYYHNKKLRVIIGQDLENIYKI